MRGTTSADVATKRLTTGQTWDAFCDEIKSAGAVLAQGPQTPLDQAEGYRYLTRLVRAGLEAFIEHADPAAPSFRRIVDETIKMGADNPDNHYQVALVDGDGEYRITGSRGTVNHLSFATQAGRFGDGDNRVTGNLYGSDLIVDPDGKFEITVSATRSAGNWLPMQPETGMLLVRQTFGDIATESPARLEIRRTDGDGRPTPPTPEAIESGLRSTTTLVAGASMMFARWVKGFRKRPNELPLFDPQLSTSVGGDPNIRYYHGYWQLEPDEALVIEATPPQCEHWNFQLGNWWMESLDYRHHRIHIGKHTAHYRDDGSVRIVVCGEDPGTENWLTTTGHASGTMCLRWIRADEHPQPTTRVVKLSELRA